MNKIKKLHILLGLLLVALICGGFYVYRIINPPANIPSRHQSSSPDLSDEDMPKVTTAKLTVDFGEGKELIESGWINRDSSETFTAYDILKYTANEKSLALEVENYDFGVFVKSINDLESTSEKAWIYFVNGESGQIAADKYELKSGDLVEWKYIIPSM